MEQYFLLFQNSKKRYWWNIFTKPLFEHVDLIIYNNSNKIITVITSNMNGIYFTYNYIDNIYSHLKGISNNDMIIIEVSKENKVSQKLIIASCVGISKRFLSIRNRLIFTPYQLYKYFKKRENILWQNQ